MKYYYVLFESAQTGYLIAKAKSNLYLKEMEKHYEQIRDFVDEQMYIGKNDQEILTALRPILNYSIDTYKADIIIKNGNNSLINMITGPGSRNAIYYLVSHDEITNFANLPRNEPSIDCFFSSIIKDEDGDDSVQELYLN